MISRLIIKPTKPSSSYFHQSEYSVDWRDVNTAELMEISFHMTDINNLQDLIPRESSDEPNEKLKRFQQPYG